MEDAARALSLMHEWESSCVIVGSPGAALTGLQFVVMVLIADVRKTKHWARDQSLRHADRDSLLRGAAPLRHFECTLALFVESGVRLGCSRRRLWSNCDWTSARQTGYQRYLKIGSGMPCSR
jgi:hypothetical protein